MALFILFKLDNIDEGIRSIYLYESSFDFKIDLNSKLLNYINQKIITKKFKQAKILIIFIKFFYNNKSIRNKLFIKFCNLKEK